MRNIELANGEFYHIYNRGVDKRPIFLDQYDIDRFFQSIQAFNALEPVGSLYELSFQKQGLGGLATKSEKLVKLVCYALNENHFHLLLEQVTDRGIEKFMHRIGGYTRYFNQKHKRSGALFQSTYKAIYVVNNEYLLHLSVYINLNDRIHQLGGLATKLGRTSWDEYVGAGEKSPICSRDIVLGQFTSPQEYRKFAEEILPEIIIRKQQEKELSWLMHEDE